MSQDKPTIDLAALFGSTKTRVVGQWYYSQNIPLDGYHFEKCRFDNCMLVSQTGDFQMTNCFISADNKIHCPQNAIRVIKLIAHKYRLMGKSLDTLPVSAVVVNNDGTISI